MAQSDTKPRRPVAACYSSPGPIYGLPSLVGHVNHDPLSAHQKNPAYTFGRRGASGTRNENPGPYYYDQQIVYPAAPRYSMRGKVNDSGVDRSKVPIAYKGIEVDYSVANRPPAYSMAGRHPALRKDVSPGPAEYVGISSPPVESKRRRAPRHAIASRSKTGGFHEDLQKTPGPGAYKDIDQEVYLPRPPNYSIASRRHMSADGANKPGPGAHSPDVKVNKKSAPKFSFGVRHSAYAVPFIVMVK